MPARASWLAVLAILLSLAAWAQLGPAVSLEDLRAAGLHARTRWLPYTKWDAEYLAYFERHYHSASLTLVPTAIVMHYTAGPTLEQAWDTFAHGSMYDDGDVGRIPGHLCSHFIIDRDGTVNYILPTNRRCRGAYGVNHVAMSVEMVGVNEDSVLGDARMMQASFRLVEFLCRYYHIPPSRVWGHYQVARGRKVVPDYLDYGDSRFPDGYPPGMDRTDPGKRYMQKLLADLQAKGL